MNRKLEIILKIIVAVFAFVLIFRRVRIEQLVDIVQHAQPRLFLVMCAIWMMTLLISSYKWKLILREYNIDLSFSSVAQLYWIGSFFNNILPTTIGGDSYKFLFLQKKYPQKKAAIVSSMLLERGLGLIAIILFAGGSGIFFFERILHTPILLIIYGCIFSIIIGIILLVGFSKKLTQKKSASALIQKVLEGLQALISFRNKKILLIGLGISIVFVLLSMLSLYAGFLAFGAAPSFLVFLFIVPCIQLARLIPISINALGITEGVGVYLFSLFGIQGELTLSVLIAGRILLIFCTATGGLFYLFQKAD